MPAKSDALGPGSLVFKQGTGPETEFGFSTTQTALEPSVSTDDDIITLKHETVPGEVQETFELTGTVLQSYDKEALIRWAFNNSGKEMDFIFIPKEDGGEWQVKGRVVIRSVRIGGEPKKRNTSDFTFRVVGRPTIGDYTPAKK